jgi:peptidylprolyl isomerase
MKLQPALSALTAAALAAAVAGCGSSSASGIVLAPGAGATSEAVTGTATAPANTTTTQTTSVTTPTSGPLASEPKITLPSGPAPTKLVVKTLIAGNGPAATKGSTIFVNYVGELYKTGKIFDASWKDTPGKAFGPIQLGAGQVIPGWDQGLVGAKQGSRVELIIPPKLAYGASGQGATIPPHATLVFDIDILKVTK